MVFYNVRDLFNVDIFASDGNYHRIGYEKPST